MRRLLIALLFALPALAQAAGPAPTITELINTSTTVTGEPIKLPPSPQLRVSTYTIAPGATLPAHKHPAQRYAYVTAGEIDVTYPDRAQTTHYKTGDFIVEAMDQWHFAINQSKRATTLLVIDQLPSNLSNNTIMRDAADE